MIEIGRVCYKIAGREAGKPCVIIESVNPTTVLIDGLVRRKKCNIKHLEFTPIVLALKKGAATSEVQEALLKNKIISEIPKKGEKRAAKPRPVKTKIAKEKPAAEKKEEHKEVKKEEHKKEEHKEAPKKEEHKEAKKENPKKEEKKPAKKETKEKKPAAKKKSK
ncbi:50S ribosomal protein L14e [Candidatus Tiddalikarchaeum anstoanum]|nr:50S ribosomal protein L14e [Candidatus Tiddalikarchaeum anstoanum]